MKKEKSKLPKKFCYAVFCNREPILYAIYSSKSDAVRYAVSLIRYRFEKAENQQLEFSILPTSFFPYVSKHRTIKNLKEKPELLDELWAKADVFTATLQIKDGLSQGLTDDFCHVYVSRYPLR